MAENDASKTTSFGLVPGETPVPFTRLAELCRPRDWNTGRYSAPALSEELSPDEMDQRLRSAHEEAFAEWLGLSIERKRADLDLYFAGLDCPKALVLETWRRLKPYRLFAPLACGRFANLDPIPCSPEEEVPIWWWMSTAPYALQTAYKRHGTTGDKVEYNPNIQVQVGKSRLL